MKWEKKKKRETVSKKNKNLLFKLEKKYLREFNELPHLLQKRLRRGYERSIDYVNCFSTRIPTILAQFVSFFCGSIVVK